MLGSLHANRDKIIKHLKRLCWSNNVETGKAVFKTIKTLLLLVGATLDVAIFYRIWMPLLCPVFLMHVLLCCILGLCYVCFLELEKRMVLCVFIPAQSWLSMYSSMTVSAPSSFYVVRPICTVVFC